MRQRLKRDRKVDRGGGSQEGAGRVTAPHHWSSSALCGGFEVEETTFPHRLFHKAAIQCVCVCLSLAASCDVWWNIKVWAPIMCVTVHLPLSSIMFKYTMCQLEAVSAALTCPLPAEKDRPMTPASPPQTPCLAAPGVTCHSKSEVLTVIRQAQVGSERFLDGPVAALLANCFEATVRHRWTVVATEDEGWREGERFHGWKMLLCHGFYSHSSVFLHIYVLCLSVSSPIPFCPHSLSPSSPASQCKPSGIITCYAPWQNTKAGVKPTWSVSHQRVKSIYQPISCTRWVCSAWHSLPRHLLSLH